MISVDSAYMFIFLSDFVLYYIPKTLFNLNMKKRVQNIISDKRNS